MISAEGRIAARMAGLRYASDEAPGLKRRRAGRGFVYVNTRGQAVRTAATLARIRALAIPPAWSEVWICTDPEGHVQATGRDQRGRKQYRYHPAWRATRDEAKFDRLPAFARTLPRIRRRVARDLRRPGLGRERVLAALVRLLDVTLIRIGNEEYRRLNGSVGLSTLRNRNVAVEGGTLHFRFRGKSGRHHATDLSDRRLAHIVRRLHDLPGQELFQYLDEEGTPQSVSSTDVNAYLRGIAGDGFSAKDFRTWAGTVEAVRALRAFSADPGAAQARRNVGAAVAEVARRLGNTPAICRRCYIHPAVIEGYLDGTIPAAAAGRDIRHRSARPPAAGLSADEKAVLTFLERRLRRRGSAAK